MGRRLAWAFVLVLSGSPAFAETVVLDAVLRGQPGCFFFVGCTELAVDSSYAVGATGLGFPNPGAHRNAFAFDLSSVSEPIVGASLVLVNPPGGYASPHRRETYAVYGVSVAVEAASSQLMFQDIGVGALLGSIEVTPSSPSVLEIPLATPILRVFERTDGLVVLGGLLTTLAFKGVPERVFEGTGAGSGVAPPRLVLTTDPSVAPAAAATLAVDAGEGDDAGDGSPGAPFASISAALDLAAPGDVVEVAPGDYSERVLLREEVTLRGSGPGTPTIDLTEPALGEPRAVICAEGAVLEGFRMLDRSGAVGSYLVECGAATEIAHNVFESSAGRSIRQSRGPAWIHENQIEGAVSVESASGVVEDNEIEASGNGVQAVLVSSDEAGAVVIRRNRIRGRLEADGDGTELTVESNLFLPDPDADSLDGAFIRELGLARVSNNTFHGTDGLRVLDQGTATIASNVLVNGTSGVLVDEEASAEIRNNDVFGNRAGFMGATTNYVGIDDQTGNNGNISEDPDFVDAFFEDFRLRPGSPARDAGSSGDVAGDEDLDGDAREVAVVDMGAQEHQPGEELPLPPLPIGVDLLPGKTPNELKFTKVAKGSGKVAIAILSDDALDAPADVDVASLILEREPVLRCSDKDVDHDDRRDLVCSFPLRGISLEGWPISEPPACVRGLTHSGRKLLGCDEVEIVP